MEQKTKVTAPAGKQEVLITRDFELPVELLFKAHTEAEIIEEWMGNKVLKLDARKHGSFDYLAIDPKGNKHSFRGAFHDVIPNQKIIRTFEMDGPFGVQLEFYDFEKITEDTSRLNMRIIYETLEQRDGVLKLPFVQGINWAHNTLQEVVSKRK
ncbi:MAG TPA: SRPBCC domain-containing protein [Cyclobacteriaceae bacterium]|nr:SRPBCC domain-containing protein [Cyclobacteriaceae bacterium]